MMWRLCRRSTSRGSSSRGDDNRRSRPQTAANDRQLSAHVYETAVLDYVLLLRRDAVEAARQGCQKR